MIICSYSNIDIIQGVIGYGDAEGITDWRISNTSNGILNILNSISNNTRITINTNGNVGIGSKDPSTITDLLDVSGNINISGIYEINGRDVINDTSNYVLSTSNILVNRIVSSATGGGEGTSQWTSVGSGIYYNTSNVGIGTAFVQSRLHIYNATTNTTTLTIQNAFTQPPNTFPTLISVSGTTSTTIGTTERCIQFPYSGTGLTMAYSFTTTENLNCDILIVGAGGAGGGNGGGGGGAGGYIYITNVVLNQGTYNVSVGRGGLGTHNANTSGNNSSITGGINYTALGGGKGGSRLGNEPQNLPQTGGSGGAGGGVGGSWGTGQVSTQNSTYGYGVGFAGANGYEASVDSAGGGGGGAGSSGTAGTYRLGGNGGNGVSNSITGSAVIYCAGGGGGVVVYGSAGSNGSSGAGSFGSGSIGGPPGVGGTSNGLNGIVIIRYRLINATISSIELIRGISGDGNIDYKIGNFDAEFKIISSVNNTNTDYVRITSTGAIYNPTGTSSWTTTSDRRIKENIEEASYNKCYDNIDSLGLYRFNYVEGFNNINKDIKQLGFIAQEVKDIFPKAVSSYNFNNNNYNIPDLLTIDITQINYTLFGAVKKLIKQNEDKDRRIKRLENLLNIEDEPIDTSNISIDTSNITQTTSNTIPTTSNISVDTSNIAIDTSNITLDTSNITIDTSNIALDTSNITLDTSNIALDTSNITLDTSNIALDTSNIAIDTSNITIDTSNIAIDTSNIATE